MIKSKTILFICDSYFYGASANAVCVQTVAEHLAKTGHKVFVVTLLNNKDQTKEESINGVKVYRIDPGIIEKMLFTYDSSSFLHKVALLFSHINGFLMATKYPLLSNKQVKNIYKKVLSISKETKLDYCVCVYHKIAGVLAGVKLKKKNPSTTKFVLYTLDAIYGGLVPKIIHSKRIPLRSLRRWERVLYGTFDSVFSMESHKKYHNSDPFYEKYTSKIKYLDIPLYLPRTLKTGFNSDVEMVYTGSLHKQSANPEYLLSIMHKLKRCRLSFYGTKSSEIDSMIKKHDLFNKRVFCYNKKSHNEIISIQNKADVLINFGNSNPNMIPCKIFEYFSSGKKVISFTHSEEDSSLPYMKKYKNGLIIDERDSSDKNIELINTFIAEKSTTIIDSSCFTKNTPAFFANELFGI